jgi:inositol-phosphate transport system substrate-binding protein
MELRRDSWQRLPCFAEERITLAKGPATLFMGYRPDEFEDSERGREPPAVEVDCTDVELNDLEAVAVLVDGVWTIQAPYSIDRDQISPYNSREAMEAGVVEEGHGYWHRPVAGPDFYHTYLGFGGRLQDPETGQLIFTQDAALGQFTLYRDMVEAGVMLRDLIGMDWTTEWHPTVTDGRVLFWSAGIWSWAQWAVQFGMGYDAIWETFGFALQPAAPEIGQPITLSQPLAYMVPADSPNQEIAVRLLSHVVTPELDVRALESGHLPILESTRALPEFQEDEFLSQVIYMLDYTTAQAIHPGFGRYDDIFFRSISAVEAGQLTPEEAVELTADELRRALGDQVIIE